MQMEEPLALASRQEMQEDDESARARMEGQTMGQPDATRDLVLELTDTVEFELLATTTTQLEMTNVGTPAKQLGPGYALGELRRGAPTKFNQSLQLTMLEL